MDSLTLSHQESLIFSSFQPPSPSNSWQFLCLRPGWSQENPDLPCPELPGLPRQKRREEKRQGVKDGHPRCPTSGKQGGPSVGSSSYRRGSAVLLPGEEGGGPREGEGCGQRERVSRASDITEHARQLHILLDIQHSHWLPAPQRKSGTSALEEMAKYECRSKPQAIQQQLQITATGNDLSVHSPYVYSVLWCMHTLEQHTAVHNKGAQSYTQRGQI